MSGRLLLSLALCAAAACAPAKPSGDGVNQRVQTVFTHFKGERVSLSINGKVEFDRAIAVAPGNERNGIAAVAQINFPNCSDLAIVSGAQQVTQKLCLNPDTKSITIDAGPPITVKQVNHFQGED